MSQHDYVIANQSGSAFRADLNNALAASVSTNSGSSAPSTTYAYMLWADTNSGYYKIRNAANNGWVSLFKLDGTDIHFVNLSGSTNYTVCTVTGADAIQGEANLTFDGSKLVIPSTGSNDANSNSDGAGFSSGSLSLRTRGATAGIAGTDYSNQIISNNGATVALEIFTTGSNSGTPVVFGTGGVQRARVETNGNFTISDGNLVVASGHGIDFGAQTTSSATGVNASTSAGDEVLDHYEKGTWTVTDASGAGLTISNSHCWYIRIGDLVHVNFYITYPSNTNSTLSKLGLLPFAAKANNFFYLNGRVSGQSNGVMFQVNAGTSVIEPFVNDSRRTNAQLSGAYVLISGCYQI